MTVRPTRVLWAAVAAAALAVPGLAVASATIVIVNDDAPGVGFNDPTPVVPVGGNPGVTRGEQRLLAFQLAAEIWGAIVDSDVTIRILASFAPLDCSAGTAVLGQAGPVQIRANFPGAPNFDTWYPVALANSLAGNDLSGSDDIQAAFNGDVDDNDGCLNATNWYYGLDNQPPGGDIDFFNTVMHEIAHGLGFSGVTDLATGSFAGSPSAMPDVFSLFTFDTDLGLHWDEMTPALRAGSATNTGDLVWDGPAVTSLAADLLSGGADGNGLVRLYAPSPLRPGSSVYHFDTTASPNLLMEPFLPSSLEAVINVDLTPALLKDIGWRLVDTDDDLVPNVHDNCRTIVNVDQVDSDADGWGDACDNCTLVPNPGQFDSDFDGYGNYCDADLNNDLVVNFADLALFKAAFLTNDFDADLNGDFIVNFGDLALLKSMFLGTPGPSGFVP